MSTPQKSTNVRSLAVPPSSGTPSSGAPRPAGRPKHPPLGAIRGALRALTLVSPALTTQWAYRMFTSPRRHPRPTREQHLLARAESLDFVCGGRVLRGWSWGQGPAVMLVHGWEGRGAQLGSFVDPLVAAGYRVVTFDGPAHGVSFGRRMTPLDLAHSMRALADWVGGVQAIVAHSMGSLATSLALQAGLLTDKVVFIAPGSHPGDATAQMAKLLDLPPSVLRGVRETLASSLGKTWHELAQADPFADHDVPLFIAHDVGDKDVPIATAEKMQRTWGNAQLYRTAGLGHRRILRDPEVVLRAVDFIGAPRTAPSESAWQSFLRLDHPLGL